MSAPQLKVHFDQFPSPPAYSPPPAYAAHSFGEHDMSFAQKEHLASMAEQKLGYLVSSKRREPSLRHVLLHAGFLERILDSIDTHVPDQYEDEPMIEESAIVIEQIAPSYDLPQSLTTIVEVDDEMEVDNDEDGDEDESESEDEDMPPLQRTISHRPTNASPSISNEEEDILSESDSDDELPSPPPVYNAAPDHPLFNLFEVREKARRDEFSIHYKIDHNDQNNIFLMNNNLAVAA